MYNNSKRKSKKKKRKMTKKEEVEDEDKQEEEVDENKDILIADNDKGQNKIPIKDPNYQSERVRE